MSCKVHVEANGNVKTDERYTVSIGVPYDGGKGCLNIFDAVNVALQGSAVGYFCTQYTPTDDSRTLLTFLGKDGREHAVNAALDSMCPEIANGFDCAVRSRSRKRDSITQSPNTQICAADNLSGSAEYQIYIGEPFQNGEGCNDIINTLNTTLSGTMVPGVPICVAADPQGSTTYLYFIGNPGTQDQVNAALNGLFPMVGGGFDCPDCRCEKQ